MQRLIIPALLFVGLMSAALLLPIQMVSGQTAQTHVDGIVFVGDSLTLGASASAPANTYVYQVVDFLGRPWNAFLSFTSGTDLDAACQAGQGGYSVAIIELGAHAVIEGQMSPDQFRQYYSALLDCAGGETVVAGTIPWLGWSADAPEYARADLYSQIIRDEAVKRGMPIADLWSAMKLQPALISIPQDYVFFGSYQGDNFHPNDAGHAVIAQTYEQAFVGEYND